MKKLLLSFLCLLSVAITSLAADEVVATLQFGSAYNSNIGSYTTTWTATVKNITWDIYGFNNNNNGWSGQIKCGNKNDASVCTIINQEPFADAISKVSVNINSITTSNVNSITLYVSTDKTFPANCDTYSINKATGLQNVEITNPVANAYYKIAFDCKKGSGNGFVAIDKVYYYKNASAVVITGLQDSYTMAVGGTKNLGAEMTLSPATADVTYDIVPATGLTIENGVMTAETPGTYTVTATATAEGQDTTTKEFTVTVTKKVAKMHFADQIVWGKLGVGVVWQQVIVDSEDANGAITYSTDSENLVIESESGQIWSNELAAQNGKEPGVKAAGEYIVTATMAENGDYNESKATYRVIIIDQNAVIIDNGYDMFDFTTNEDNKYFYGLRQTDTNDNTNNDETKYVTEVRAMDNDAINYVSIKFDSEGSRNRYCVWKNGNTYELRAYEGNKMTFEVPEGYTISQIGLTGNAVSGTFDPAEEGEHKVIEGLETQPTLKSHWHAGENQKLNKVTLNITGSSKINQIYVLYEADNSSLKPANLSFDQTYYPIYAGEKITLPAVENPHNLPVTYTIQNLAEESYTITPSADGKTIDVLLDETGSYTLEASSKQTDEYRTGYAIMRLNAYNHLDVKVADYFTDEEIELQKTEDGEEYFVISQDNDDMYKLTMDVPEDAELWFRVIIPGLGDLYDQFGGIFADDTPTKDKNEDGYRNYAAYGNSIMTMGGAFGDIDFYIESYGYRSPVRSIGMNPQYPAMFLLSAMDFDTFEQKGETLKHVYEDHSVKNSNTHTFALSTLAAKNVKAADPTVDNDMLCMIEAPGMVNLKAEPMFTPVTADDLEDYDKDNTDLIYEEPTFDIDYVNNIVYMTCKHAGLYKVTATLGKYTFMPGLKSVGYVEVTPNMAVSDSQDKSDVYFHGITLNDAGNGVFTLNISPDNPKGHIHYIYTGHPTYGSDNGLWYQLHYDNGGTTIPTPANMPQFAATPDEDKWIKADHGFDLVNEEGKAPSDIHLKLTTNGVTKVHSYAIGDIATKVEGIESMGEDEVIYVDLNGNRVAEPANGIFIRIRGGKADKVVVK